MLIREKVAGALEEKREALRQGAARAGEAQDRYLEALDELSRLSADRVENALGGVAWPGARPTDELTHRALVQPFPHRWATAREARAWAMDVLRGVSTVAVDGSQVAASKEYAVPVSLVQVAWFENHHQTGRPYVKDVRDEVLVPDSPPGEVEEYVFAESRLNQRRFGLEMQVAAERLQALAARRGDRRRDDGQERQPALRVVGGEEEALYDPRRPPVVFVDGTFVLSFTSRMVPDARRSYLQALVGLLRASERCRVPVVGYVDASLASDLVTMLRVAFDLPPAPSFDAQLLARRMEPFDRSAAFQCARGDVLPLYAEIDNGDWTRELHFVYLKTGQDRLPARIDFPAWVLHEGLLDHVVDVVRAEAVVGSGYPYALETADAAAVLTTEDRRAFYRLWQDFARASGLDAVLPGKSVSKAHRR